MKTNITITSSTLTPPIGLSYTEMTKTKGVFDMLDKHGERVEPNKYVINLHGTGNSESSNTRPLYVSRAGHVETLSTVAWESYRFRKSLDSVTLAFSNEG